MTLYLKKIRTRNYACTANTGEKCYFDKDPLCHEMKCKILTRRYVYIRLSKETWLEQKNLKCGGAYVIREI